MNALYLLQFSCLLVSAMMALMLVTARFHVQVVNHQYERSRWMLFSAMLLLVVHYSLQISYGIRARSDEAGLVVNILFYSPVAMLMADAILNIECAKKRRRRYEGVGLVLCCMIFAVFAGGIVASGRLSLPPLVRQILLLLFMVVMLADIAVPLVEMHRNRGRVEAETGGEIGSYIRYSWLVFTIC